MGRANLNQIFTDDQVIDLLTDIDTGATACGLYSLRRIIREAAEKHGIEIFQNAQVRAATVFDKAASDTCQIGDNACLQEQCPTCHGCPF